MVDVSQRFGGIQRLYGAGCEDVLEKLHVLVLGIGGVGSWVVESLARSNVGNICIVDGDVVDVSNVNRQLHALTSTVDQPKVEVMAQRVADINPACKCNALNTFLNSDNKEALLSGGYDYVVDALDSIKFKAEIIAYCKRNKIPLVTVGGAGGLTDPTQIQVADLSKTFNDPLMSKVRSRLRSDFGFTRNLKRSFGVECVFSAQQPLYPKPDGTVGHEKPGVHGVSLDCRFGYGSATFVTASFGMMAASRVVNRSLERARAK